MSNGRKIIHIDMDCFYAAIEVRDFPELSNKPIAVGGDAVRRGVISTCNYMAREFGVRSAMATARAFRLCPSLVVQPVRMAVYKQESRKIRQVFAKYTDLIEPLSLDEAYLDVTGSSHCKGSATLIAQSIRREILQSTGLTASAGIAPNKVLAKIASDWHKPNGQKVITPEEIDAFIRDLPVRKLFGVGPKMEEKLQNLGISTCETLQKLDRQVLTERFGSFGERLYLLARGIDDRPVNPERVRKSISVEETFITDLSSFDDCKNELPALISKLKSRIQAQENPLIVNGIFVKVKFSDFSQTTAESRADELNDNIVSLLLSEAWERKKESVRLLGVGIRIKTDEPPYKSTQLTLPGFG